MKKIKERYIDKSKNREIFNRLKQHFGVKFDKEVLDEWGMHDKSMNNWRTSGIPKNELALLAEEENLNYMWIIKGEGEKNRGMPTPHLAPVLQGQSASIYKDDFEEKLCKAFSKISSESKKNAFQDAIGIFLGYYD